MRQAMGKRTAQQQMMSRKCMTSRHVNHDGAAGVNSSMTTIATSTSTCTHPPGRIATAVAIVANVCYFMYA